MEFYTTAPLVPMERSSSCYLLMYTLPTRPQNSQNIFNFCIYKKIFAPINYIWLVCVCVILQAINDTYPYKKLEPKLHTVSSTTGPTAVLVQGRAPPLGIPFDIYRAHLLYFFY